MEYAKTGFKDIRIKCDVSAYLGRNMALLVIKLASAGLTLFNGLTIF